MIIEVVRPGSPHVNEDRLDPEMVDAVIHNDSSLEVLGMRTFHAMDQLFTID
jgi:hypothetical protein